MATLIAATVRHTKRQPSMPSGWKWPGRRKHGFDTVELEDFVAQPLDVQQPRACEPRVRSTPKPQLAQNVAHANWLLQVARGYCGDG